MAAIPACTSKYTYSGQVIVRGDFYISPDGKDSNIGTFDAPFATIEKARDEIRRLRTEGNLPANGITVCILAGEYNNNGIFFLEQDSGSEEAPIRYRAYGNGEVVFNCGFKLRPEDFRHVSGEMRSRLQRDAQEKVVSVDLKKYGLTIDNYGKISAVGAAITAHLYDNTEKAASCELYFNGKRMITARYPNGNEFLKIAAVRDVGDFKEFPQQNVNNAWGKRNLRGGTLVVDRSTNERIKKWQNKDGIWIYGYFYHDWADSSTPVIEFDTDLCSLVIWYASTFGFRADAPYYFYNVFDDGLSGQTAYGNILVNIGKYGFLIGGGNENTARHNILINAGSQPFLYDDRVHDGYINDGWARGLSENKETGILWEILHKTPYTNELWSDRYPILSCFSEDESDPDNPHFPINPAFSVIEENIIVDKNKPLGWFADSVYKYSTIRNNAVFQSCEEVGFVDAENGDYRLRDDAPVRKLLPGFPDIPFDKIGRN